MSSFIIGLLGIFVAILILGVIFSIWGWISKKQHLRNYALTLRAVSIIFIVVLILVLKYM